VNDLPKTFARPESYPVGPIPNISFQPLRAGLAILAISAAAGCSTNPADTPPPTIAPAQAAASPPASTDLEGTVRPLGPGTHGARFDPVTRALVVMGPGPEGQTALTVFASSPPGAAPRTVLTPSAATAMTGDDAGRLLLSTRRYPPRVDIASGAVTRTDVDGQSGTDFTAIARRGDGRLVLGTADGAVLTLDSDTEVGAELPIFARVDALVTQGDTTVVLDRGQTSVTAVDSSGEKAAQALRAGDGATTIAADSAGRVLVADTRGDELLVFGADPLIMRQRYPVPGAPYGLAASAQLAWVSQTATNTVIGYDLATGIPVEKVRHRTVQQPNDLAYDEASDTLYVVSGSGAGVQVIPNAGEVR
jgi:DNA-binding beta-propeller fold protein YncE